MVEYTATSDKQLDSRIQDDKTTTLDILTADFTSESSFPYDGSAESAPPLVHSFISSARIKDLVGQFKLQVVQKLMPSLRKEGYEERWVGESEVIGFSHSSILP